MITLLPWSRIYLRRKEKGMVGCWCHERLRLNNKDAILKKSVRRCQGEEGGHVGS